MRCPHCNEQLPGVLDAFCPFCRGELKSEEEGNTPRNWIIPGIVLGVVTLVFLPMMAFPLVGLTVLGIACFRPAIQYRQAGWISGAVMGALFFIVGLAGLVGILLGVFDRFM